ncbi:MAG: NAD-dependent epimerase/dehydratase family protein [Bacteroidales bacterium]|nr:NAD-dependent epimerase/dehydratase family protein [Bacteroidales bacterium]
MKVLITGGAGYIGAELVKRLQCLESVSKIIVYDNLLRNNYNFFIHAGINRNKVTFVKGDILDSRKLKKNIKEVDVVFHLAAVVSTPFSYESSAIYEEVNTWGTAEVAYAAEECNIQKIIYLSSISVYGSSSDYFDENSIPNPQSFYGVTKLRGEHHIRRLSSKINTIILRCANVYGYGSCMRFDAVINKFLIETLFQKKINIYGDGNQKRTFIYIDYLINLLINILQDNVNSGVYNVVDKVMSINQIAETLKKIEPTLEIYYLNQHLKMCELLVKHDQRINKIISQPMLTFEEELYTTIGFIDSYCLVK